MKMKEKCICKEQLGIDNVYVHLSWCPESYVYKEDIEKYQNANWFKKLFMYKPWKHPYGI